MKRFSFLSLGLQLGLCALAVTAGCARDIEDAENHAETTSAICAAPNVAPLKELMIVHSSVVNSAAASNTTGNSGGPLSFRHLMTRLAGPGADVAAFTEAFMNTWKTDQHVGAFTVPAARDVDQLLNPSFGLWRRMPNGQLDMANAPFRLIAVANRMDLARADKPNGEGRLIFGLVTPGGTGLPMAFIFEYNLPDMNGQTQGVWAQRWHHLGQLPFGADYNAALTDVVEAFAAPENLAQLRSNEVFMAGRKWELREFHLDAQSGHLVNAPIAQTPDFSLNNQPQLIDWVNANANAILADDYTVPAELLGGVAFNVLPVNSQSKTFEGHRWLIDPNGQPLVQSEALRKAFAKNTCNGCHQTDVPDGKSSISTFYQVSVLGGPLTGDGKDRLSTFILESELPRRASFLAARIPCTTNETTTCSAAYAQSNCLSYVQGTQVSRDGHNWLCTNGNCANCSWVESCTPGGTGCPWGLVWTDTGSCE